MSGDDLTPPDSAISHSQTYKRIAIPIMTGFQTIMNLTDLAHTPPAEHQPSETHHAYDHWKLPLWRRALQLRTQSSAVVRTLPLRILSASLLSTNSQLVQRSKYRLELGQCSTRQLQKQQMGRTIFCATCGSQMGYRSDRLPDEFHGLAASLRAPEDFTPKVHYFHREALPWLHIHDQLPRFADGGKTLENSRPS